MVPFDQLMRELAQYLGTPLAVNDGIYNMMLQLPSGRHQSISAIIRRNHNNVEVIDFVSTIGPIERTIDPWRLLATNSETTFCRVIANKGMLFVVATQLRETAQPQEVLWMLREVAEVADKLEQQRGSGDEN